MTKFDFKKELKHLYSPSKKDFAVVDVPPMSFLQIDGHGDPNTADEYKQAVETLFALAFNIKFRSKKELGRDYVVPPLEGLWWAEDMDSFITRDKNQWDWTMMIMQPDWISAEMVSASIATVGGKKDLPALPKVEFSTYNEGLSVQILHLGSYDDEGPTIHRMHHEWMPTNGYTENGVHHEIYLSDPRKTVPEKLRTVLRQPIKKVDG